jgi:phage shock protein A
MGIMSRVIRLCKADLNAVMDQMEDRDLLLRQHLREMQAALEERQARLERMEALLRVGRRQMAIHRKRLEALAADLDLALSRGRDDSARMLIRKLLPLRRGIGNLANRLKEVAAQLDDERQRLLDQRMAYDETRLQVAAARENLPGSAFPPNKGFLAMPSQAGPDDEEIEWELFLRKEAAGPGRSA